MQQINYISNGAGQVAQLVEVLSHIPKGCGFDSQLGDIWEATNQCFSLTWMFLVLPSSLSKINKYILGWGLKNYTHTLAGVAQWLSAGLRITVSLVQFPVRAHAWAGGQVPSRGHTRSNHKMFLSLPFSLPCSKKINKISINKIKINTLYIWIYVTYPYVVKKSILPKKGSGLCPWHLRDKLEACEMSCLKSAWVLGNNGWSNSKI